MTNLQIAKYSFLRATEILNAVPADATVRQKTAAQAFARHFTNRGIRALIRQSEAMDHAATAVGRSGFEIRNLQNV